MVDRRVGEPMQLMECTAVIMGHAVFAVCINERKYNTIRKRDEGKVIAE